jgi:uncharacterized membrane protein
MTRGRLEAFSDGVIAILITIMVLELKPPDGTDLGALRESLRTSFPPYAMSFVFLGIYWNNHHHMLHLVDRINGRILWANLHLLFWLSLVPFATSWIGKDRTAPVPTATYGVVLLLAAVAFLILERSIVTLQGPNSKLKAVVGKDVKGKISALLYVSAIPLAFVDWWIADAIYVLVGLIWLVPDRRIESTLK